MLTSPAATTDVATFWTTVGTVVAALAGLMVLLQVWLNRKADQRVAAIVARTDQARLVSAWIEPDPSAGSHPSRHVVYVRNGSDEPIFAVHPGYKGLRPWRMNEIRIADRAVIPPQTCLEIPVRDAHREDYVTAVPLVISFRDARGNSWTRTDDGAVIRTGDDDEERSQYDQLHPSQRK